MKTFLVCTAGFLSGCATTHVPTFRAGDVVVARNFTRYPQYNGTRVKVVADFKWRWIRELQGNAMRVYEIETVDGQRLAAQPFQLQQVEK